MSNTPQARPSAEQPSLSPNRFEARFNLRTLTTTLLTWLTFAAATIALIPLLSIVEVLVRNGGKGINWSVLTRSAVDGGMGHAFVGTAVMVGLASLMATPLGMLAAIHLAEFGRGTRSASFIRSAARVLSGVPSILAGVFAYGLVVASTKKFSAVAGAVALALLMIPMVVLAAEQALLAVPKSIRDAALALGATPTQTVVRAVVPAAWPGMLTGVLLAVARVAGETAPLLFTALFSRYWIDRSILSINPRDWENVLMKPTASLAVFIYNYSTMADDAQKEQAWTAALLLVFAILLVNIAGRVWSQSKAR